MVQTTINDDVRVKAASFDEASRAAIIQLSYPGYDLLAATAVLLIEALPHS